MYIYLDRFRCIASKLQKKIYALQCTHNTGRWLRYDDASVIDRFLAPEN